MGGFGEADWRRKFRQENMKLMKDMRNRKGRPLIPSSRTCFGVVEGSLTIFRSAKMNEQIIKDPSTA
jgi:hypothetical protein